MLKLSLKRGIVIDRCQPCGLPRRIAITEQDIRIIRSTGADHVKLLFTPDAFMEGHHFDTTTAWYIQQSVDLVLGQGISCLICIHPEASFKEYYLSSAECFAQVLPFYHRLCRWLSDRYDSSQVAFQIMTEPFANYCDWNILGKKLWQTVRQAMPEHTLVLSGDQIGHLNGMLALEPVDDDNVYYGFTTYDPTTFTLQSWHSFFSFTTEHLDPIGHVPYPANEQIVEERMKDMLQVVTPEYIEEAKEYLRGYGKGNYIRGNRVWENQGCFNRSWIDARMDRIVRWREKHGKHLPVLCNEFGVMDPVMGRKYGGIGILPEERLLFLKDLRESMEQRNIGWSYWSYNETFTIFKAENREPFGQGNQSRLDCGLLQALGLLCDKGEPVE